MMSSNDDDDDDEDGATVKVLHVLIRDHVALHQWLCGAANEIHDGCSSLCKGLMLLLLLRL